MGLATRSGVGMTNDAIERMRIKLRLGQPVPPDDVERLIEEYERVFELLGFARSCGFDAPKPTPMPRTPEEAAGGLR
jgi:hypothetical protein